MATISVRNALDEQSKKADRCPEVANGKKQETGNKIMNGLRATVIMPLSVKNKEVCNARICDKK